MQKTRESKTPADSKGFNERFACGAVETNRRENAGRGHAWSSQRPHWRSIARGVVNVEWGEEKDNLGSKRRGSVGGYSHHDILALSII